MPFWHVWFMAVQSRLVMQLCATVQVLLMQTCPLAHTAPPQVTAVPQKPVARQTRPIGHTVPGPHCRALPPSTFVPGHAGKVQFGPVRETKPPFGHACTSAGHTMPPSATPASEEGHAGKVQFGPVRETKLPSGHISASAGHAMPPSVGHAGNVQFGPVRDTELPSAQRSTSAGHTPPFEHWPLRQT